MSWAILKLSLKEKTAKNKKKTMENPAVAFVLS
jgi:hypothetical protein